MTGANSTAIRAGLMAILMLFARATGRNYDVFRALLLTAFLMILFNPFILFFDISFQLSFIATIAVIFFSPRIERYFFWVPKQFKMRDIICVTFSAYLFVLPFILFKMGNLSIVALPANILILPFIPLTMAFGFFSGFIGLFSPLLAMPISYLTYLFLSYELFIVNFFAEISFASFSISNFPLLITLAIYAYFIYFLFGKSIKKFFLETEN
jgi:competence protein ComEC